MSQIRDGSLRTSTTFAFVSDIHGNARALGAVLEDLEARRVDTIVNLGDSLYGPFDPRSVADCLLAAGWPTVAGNEDRCLVDPDGPDELAAARFTRERLAPEHLAWIESLPGTLRIGPAILFHGTPSDDTAYLLSRPDGAGGIRAATAWELRESLAGIAERVLLCAHDHIPRTARLEDGRTIVNPGSVGCPAYTDDRPVPHTIENGTPHARYAVVRIHGDWIDVDLREVVYDWDAAAEEAARNGFREWACWIATGRAASRAGGSL